MTDTKIQKNKFVLKAKTKKSLQIYALAAIPLLLVLIFNYIPMFGIVIAFKNYRYDLGIFGSEWVGLDNFKVFLMSDDFIRIARNTLGMNGLFIACSTVCQVALAMALFEVKKRAAVKTYQTVMITPHFLSWVVAGTMLYAFLHPTNGIINQIVEALGGEAVDWYSKPNAWPIILLICSVWKGVGMGSVVYYANLMGISSEIFEAAKIDGANKWQEVIHITVPQLVPLIIIQTILAIGNIFRADFGLFYQTTRDVGALYSTTDVMDTYIFRTMRVLGDTSISSAAGVFQSIVGFICVMTVNGIVNKIDPERALF